MTSLSTLMRSRVDAEYPDLAALTAASISRGRRIRRVRHAAAGLATAAVVAGVAVGAAALGGGGQTAATELQPAAGRSLDVSQPAPTPSAIALDLSPVEGGTLVRVPPTGGALSSDPNLNPLESDPKHHHPTRETVPFQLTLKGWSCGLAADEKLICTGPQHQSVEIIWRPASTYQEWIGDPDKGRDASVVTTEPHGAWFAAVQGNAATATSDLHAVADAIHWK